MTAEIGSPGACPTCGRTVEGGLPTAPGGAFRCSSCGDSLCLRDGAPIRHRIAKAILPMWVAADRLRNHLRRLAIVRLGRIEGDCYFLPFVRIEGRTSDGDETFTLLAVTIGEERLERAHLPAADVVRFEEPAAGSAGRSGNESVPIRVMRPTLSKQALAARVEPHGWSLSRELEIVHFPFWLMRVEDRGRIEGAWMDGVEGRLIHHRIRLTAPVPSRRAAAALTALPGAVVLAAGAASATAALPAAAAAWAAGVPLLYYAILRRWHG